MTPPNVGDLLVMPTDIADLPLPDNGFYYVATKTGFMVHKPTFFGRALVPVATLDSAGAAEPALWRAIPKLPPELLGQAWSFFRAIFASLGTESMVYITWHAEHGYRLFIPPQACSMAHVTVTPYSATNKHGFNPENIKDGWHNVGTIHSHCNFGAFHSGTDTGDADKHDGLHITIGHVDRDPSPEWAIMVMINGIQWDFKLEDITDTTPAITAHPKWWHRYVVKDTGSSIYGTAVNYNYGGTGYVHAPSNLSRIPSIWDDDEGLYGTEHAWRERLPDPTNPPPAKTLTIVGKGKSNLPNLARGSQDLWPSLKDLLEAAAVKWPAAFMGWNFSNIDLLATLYEDEINKLLSNAEIELGVVAHLTWSSDPMSDWEDTIFADSPLEEPTDVTNIGVLHGTSN